MSTFVPLAADNEGTLSAVALGDWLLTVIKLKKYDQMEMYCEEFVKQFTLNEMTNEQQIVDPVILFNMFLSHQDAVFSYLVDARDKNEIIMLQSSTTNDSTTNLTEIKKAYPEVYKEVEEFFIVLMSLVVLRFNDTESMGKAAADLCNVFRSSHDLAEFRLKMFQTLYNVFPSNFPYRSSIFLSILEYAAETNQFHVIVPSIKYINEWIKDWNLSIVSKRKIYLILAQQLKKLDIREDAYLYLKLHVEQFQGESIQTLREEATIAATIELLLDAIKLPDIMYFDSLLTLHAVDFLRKTKHTRLVDLLIIFIRGNLSDLEAFRSMNHTFFDDYGIDYNECYRKLQLLSLVEMADQSSVIEISQISEALKLPDSEELIVQAIGQGLLDAKIDQMNKVVHVKSSMQREFTLVQWENLRSRLENWVESVGGLLRSLEQVKQQKTQPNDRGNGSRDKENFQIAQSIGDAN